MDTHPQCVKWAVILSLAIRMDKPCNDDVTRKREMRHFHMLLLDNGYPTEVNESASRGKLPTHSKNDTNCLTSVDTPYKSGTSKAVIQILSSYGVRVFGRIDNTLQNHVIKTKDPQRLHDQDNCTCLISCKNCQAQYYEANMQWAKNRNLGTQKQRGIQVNGLCDSKKSCNAILQSPFTPYPRSHYWLQ